MTGKKTPDPKFTVLLISVFIVTVAAVCFPLFRNTAHDGHDYLFHFGRFAGLIDGIENGIFPVRMNYTFFFGGGYGSPLFYPDFFMVPFAALAALGLGGMTAFKLFLLSSVSATFLVSAYAIKGMFKSSPAALIGAVLYTSADYFIRVLYRRSSYGEILVFIFLPLLVYAMYNLFFEKFNKPALLVISLSALILSHVISAAICAVFCLAALIIGIRYLFKNPRILLRLAACVILSMALTAFFWVPMLEQLLSDSFQLTSAYNASVSKEAVPLPDMFFRLNPRFFGFRLLGLLLLRFLFITKKPDKKALKIADGFAIVGVALLFLASDLFPWKLLSKPLAFIQFPWRLYLPATLCLSFAVCIYVIQALSLAKIASFKKPVCILLITLQITMTVLAVLSNFTPAPIPAEWLADKRSVYPNTGFEYFRSDRSYTDALYFTYFGNVEDSGGEILPSVRDYDVIRIMIDRETPSVRTPFLYYLGYEAKYTRPGESPVKLPVHCDDELQIVVVETADAEPGGTLFVRYAGTAAQHISFRLSAAAALCLFAIATTLFIRKKRGTPV